MKEINKKLSNKFSNKEKTKDFYTKLSYDLGDNKINKSKPKEKRTKSLLNFISLKKKIIFKSPFDQKGAKKFLADKEKALEEIILIDEFEDKKNSENNLQYFSKKNKSYHKKSKNNLMSEKKIQYLKNITNSKNINDIGRINEKINKNRALKYESIKSKYSNINTKENTYLMTGESDSFICTIINEMNNYKN